MNISLVDSYAFPSASMDSYYRSAPLGLLSIAGGVRDIADKITIFDDRLPNRKQLEKTDVLGVRAMAYNIPYAMEFLQRAKRVNPNIKTVIGGFHATLNPEDVDYNFVDHIVKGEGEISFRNILIGKNDERIVESPLVENLDDLPFPAYDLVNMLKYHSFGMRAIMLETSRGCPYNCNFCNVKKFYHNRYRVKSIDRVITEIKRYTKRNQISVQIIDDNHTLNVKRVMRLCDAIIDNGLDHIFYFCQSRVDTLARHPELVKRMAEAGYYSMFLGVESPYQETMESMNKDTTWEQAKQAVRLLNNNGIIAFTSLVVGSPNETAVMVKQYPKFVQELQASIAHFWMLTYFPNTDAYNQIKDDIPILIDDLRYYDGMTCTFLHPHIDPRQLNEIYAGIYKEYYSDIKSYLPLMLNSRKIVGRMALRRFKRRIRRYIEYLRELNPIKKNEIILDNVFSIVDDWRNLFQYLSKIARLYLSGGRVMISENINEVNRKLNKILEEEE